MLNIKTPNQFLDLALQNGIPDTLAHDIYQRKAASKTVDDVLANAVLTGYFDNIAEARKAYALVWRDWVLLTKSSAIMEAGSIKTSSSSQSYMVAVEPDKESILERAYSALESMIGPCGTTAKSKTTANNKIILASDFHLPFLHKPTLNAIMASDSDHLIIAGDFMDMYSASSHRPSIDYLTATEEIAIARATLEMLAKKFKTIKMISGNHENRVVKKIQNLAPQLQPLVIHPLKLISYGLDNVSVENLTIPNTAPMSAFATDIDLDFAMVESNMLVGHFEEFCGDDAPVKLEEWLNKFSHKLPFKVSDIKAVFQAHTHRLNMRYTATGRLLISTGCACGVQEYVWRQHSKYSPPTPGFVELFYDEKGNIDFPQTKLVYTG